MFDEALELSAIVPFDSESVGLSPYLLAAGGGLFYVADVSQRVTALRPDGTVAWRFGRKGAGPGEFTMIRDMEPVPGGVAVYDPNGARIVVLGSDGSLIRQVALGGVPRGDQLAALAGDEFAVIATAPLERKHVFVVTADGKASASFQWPWAAYDSLDPIARQMVSVSRPSGVWVAAFRMGDGWYVLRDSQVVGGAYPLVEHVDFPSLIVERDRSGRVATRLARADVSAMSLALAPPELLVLVGGHGDSAFRRIDVHALSNGSYQRSMLLPVPSSGIAVTAGHLASLTLDPRPELRIFDLIAAQEN